jgi:hypothetical protein
MPMGSAAVPMESLVVPMRLRSLRDDLSSMWDYLPAASVPVVADN